MFFCPLSHRNFSPRSLFFLHWINCFSLVRGCFLKIYLLISNQILLWKQMLFSLFFPQYIKCLVLVLLARLCFLCCFFSPQLYKNGSRDALTPRLGSSNMFLCLHHIVERHVIKIARNGKNKSKMKK